MGNQGFSGMHVLALESRRAVEIEKLIRAVPGFISWTLIRTGDTCMTATICVSNSFVGSAPQARCCSVTRVHALIW